MQIATCTRNRRLERSTGSDVSSRASLSLAPAEALGLDWRRPMNEWLHNMGRKLNRFTGAGVTLRPGEYGAKRPDLVMWLDRIMRMRLRNDLWKGGDGKKGCARFSLSFEILVKKRATGASAFID